MEFDFKPLAESDLQLLFDWLNRSHVAEWWGGPVSLSAIRDEYMPLIRPSSSIRPYIVRLNGSPVGFIQSYVVMADQTSGWWSDEQDPGAMGIDQFLADTENLGKGMGTDMLTQFIDLLFSDPAVSKIQADPAPNNLRAIRCYEKAGFRKVAQLPQ
jgi:aminoglycoside 6'-N-acetyltransferase-1b